MTSMERPPSSSAPPAEEESNDKEPAYKPPKLTGPEESILAGNKEEDVVDVEFSSQSQKRLEYKENYQPENKWKPYLEQITGKQEKDKETLERRKWLENIFSADGKGAGDFSREREAIISVIKNNLLRENKADRTRFDNRRADNEAIFIKAQAKILDLEARKISFHEMLDNSKTTDDIKTLKLISLSLLDPHMVSDRKSWNEMSEGQKRMIRIGELIGLEAERRQIEASMDKEAFRKNKDVAQRAANRYQGYAASADVPPTFVRRFNATTEKLAGILGVKPEVKARTERGQDVKVSTEKYYYGRRASPETRATPATEDFTQSEGQPIVGEVERNTSFESVMREEFAKVGSVPEESFDNFMKYFPEQLAYARGINELGGRRPWYHHPAVPVWGQVRWLAERAARIDAHWQVFGPKGAFECIISPYEADQKLREVRGNFNKAAILAEKKLRSSQGVDSSAGEQYIEYVKEFALANQSDRVNMEARSRNLAAFEEGAQKTFAWIEKGADRLFERAARLFRRREEALEITQFEEPLEITDFVPTSYQEVRNNISNWHRNNPEGTYNDWKGSAESNTYQILKREADARNMKPKQLWKALGRLAARDANNNRTAA